MIQPGLVATPSSVEFADDEQSKTREAVRRAIHHQSAEELPHNGDHNGISNGLSNGTANGNGHYYGTNGSSTNMTTAQTSKRTKASSFLDFIQSFLEFLFLSLYKCLSIVLHSGLAISFLAMVAVAILGSFHDRYWVTILQRARRTDADLVNEITYYQRECDATDVTTSSSHHIHFGIHNDRASEMFIDVDKLLEEYHDSHGQNGSSDIVYDERGFRTRYQQDDVRRSRRRFAPAWNIWETPQLRPIPDQVAKEAGKQAVHAMMKHGSVMVPKILSDATIAALRTFIDEKNEATLGTSDEYPMTASHHRISYGIESTEHPAVVKALQEIHDHKVFAELIQNLVGDENPALSEITAITAWEGAEDQSWHPDVKPDGNGVKYGRTYSHSYSLFLPLQDTTQKMGATELCPGTYMCATESMHDVCGDNSIDLSEVRRARPRHEYRSDASGEQLYKFDKSMEGLWRAGDGALLNQQGWHRGTAHTEEGKDDRIVFIVSFLKRPHSEDPRQLARGTYFHQKWLNWGSTWEDMSNTMANLQRPWNILRCLHLFKPRDRSWGYDLFTATTLRVANGQMGGEPEDLDGLLDNFMIPLQYPEWLQGEIDYEDENAWQVYMSGTITKTFDFLKKVNTYGHLGLAAFLALSSVLGYLYNRLDPTSKNSCKPSVARTVLTAGVKRLVLTHGSILALGFYVWHSITSSNWAIDIDSGKTLMRPFPSDPVYLDDDPGAAGTISTLPRRSDVLIGTRMHTKAIGAYHTYLEYHPGNRVLDQFIDAYGGTGGFYHSVLPTNSPYHTTSGLSSGLSENLVDTAINMITKNHGGGRFLMQDYRSGDWMVLSDDESRNYVRKRLLVGKKLANTLGAMREEIDLLMDKQRFGFVRRNRSMSWNTQLFLHDLSKTIFSTSFERATRPSKQLSTKKMVRRNESPAYDFVCFPKNGYRMPKWDSIGATVSTAKDRDGNRKFLLDETQPSYRPGMEIYIQLKEFEEGKTNLLYPGTIVDISRKRFKNRRCRYRVALDEAGVNEMEEAVIDDVQRSEIWPRKPITSGSRVAVDLNEDGEYFDGTVALVLADGSIDVEFDDGDFEQGIPIEQYVAMDAVIRLEDE